MGKNRIRILVIIAIALILASPVIYAQDTSDDDNLVTIEKIVQKIEELSRFRLSFSMYAVYPLYTFVPGDTGGYFTPFNYMVLNMIIQYSFSDISYLYINANFGADGKINMSGLPDSLNTAETRLNKFEYYQNITKLFNVNFFDLSLSFGYDQFTIGLKKPLYENFIYGTSNAYFDNLFINLDVSFSFMEASVYSFPDGSVAGQIILKFLNLFQLGFEIMQPDQGDPIIGGEVLADFLGIEFYLVLESYDTADNTKYLDFSGKAEYRITNIFNWNINIIVSLFYDKLGENNPLSCSNTESSAAEKLIYDSYSRVGSELYITYTYFQAGIVPYYNLEDSTFYADGFLMLTIFPLFIKFEVIHSLTDIEYNGVFISFGINSTF